MVSLSIRNLGVYLWNIICLCSRQFFIEYKMTLKISTRIELVRSATRQCRTYTTARKMNWNGMASRSWKRKGNAKCQLPTSKVCSKQFGLIYRSPLFLMIASKGCAHPSHQCLNRKEMYFVINTIERGENLWTYPCICPAQL